MTLSWVGKWGWCEYQSLWGDISVPSHRDCDPPKCCLRVSARSEKRVKTQAHHRLRGGRERERQCMGSGSRGHGQRRPVSQKGIAVRPEAGESSWELRVTAWHQLLQKPVSQNQVWPPGAGTLRWAGVCQLSWKECGVHYSRSPKLRKAHHLVS